MDSDKNQVYLVIMYILYQTGEMLENSTNFNTVFQIFPVSTITTVDTLNTFLFAAFCSDPTSHVKFFSINLCIWCKYVSGVFTTSLNTKKKCISIYF